jgi:nitroreductase
MLAALRHLCEKPVSLWNLGTTGLKGHSMSSFLDLARRRQSTRRYLNTPVPRDVIDRCLDAARLAPSACNSQPWHFIVADRDPLRGELAEAAFAGVYAMNRFAAQAGALIVVVTERSKYAARLGGMIRGIQYSLVDIGIAGEHIALQAAEEGLGTCWLGWFDEKAVKRTLRLARGARIDVMISLGYPADADIRPKKRLTLDEVRRYYPSSSSDEF